MVYKRGFGHEIFVRGLMEKHISELEARMDGELVDALDDSISQKIEDNSREKTR